VAEGQSISFEVKANITQAEEKFKTIKQQISDIRKEMDSLVQAKDKGSLGELEYETKIAEARTKEIDLLKQQSILESNFATTRDKQLQQEASQRMAIAKAIEQQRIASEQVNKAQQDELTTLRQMTRELENQKIRYVEQKNPYMAQQIQSQIDSLSGLKKSPVSSIALPTAPLETYVTLQTKISKVNEEAQKYYTTMVRSKDAEEKLAASKGFSEKKLQLQQLTTDLDGFNKAMGTAAQKADYLGSFMQKFRSHFNWMVTGLVLGATFAIPVELIQSIKEVEQGMAGMQQVNKGLHSSQEALNEQTMKFINIAAVYGEKVKDIIEAGKLWGRAYKDLAIVNALVHQSAILTVADNLSLVDANKSLEAAMFQYGLVAKNAAEATAYGAKIVDVYTNVAHNAQASAQDLAHGVEQAGSVAHMTGVDFEFLTAMIATGVRATGKSGNEIGTMIKSVLGSFRSDKAQAELDKLGIAVKEVGKDGEVSFRKAQDVLLDLALTAQTTDKDLEKLFQAISGGKWQWSKASAMLGDYKTFIETWGLALNSAGFAAGQIKMQMDTLARQIEKLKADLQGLAVETGNAGFTNFIKGLVSGLDRAALGLQMLSSTQIKFIAGTTTLILGIGAAASVLSTYKEAAKEAAAATTLLGKATAYASKWNLVITVLAALSFAIGSYLEMLGEAKDKERESQQQAQDNIATASQQIDMYEKQAQFIDNLFAARAKLIAQSQQEGLSDEKLRVIKADLAATDQQLTNILGQDAMKHIRDNGYSEGSIKQEKDAFVGAIDEKKVALKTMQAQLVVDLDNKVQWLQNCVDAYYQEVDAFKDSITKKINLLGVWKAALLTAQEWNTGYHEKLASLNRDAAERTTDEKQKQVYLDMASQEDEAAEQSRQKGKAIVNEGLQYWLNELNKAQQDRIRIATTGIDYNPPASGGRNADGSGGSGKGAKNPPQDRTASLQSKVDFLELEQIMSKHKIATDKYNESLNNLKTSEELYGVTVDSTANRIKLMTARLQELKQTQDSISGLKQTYIDKINSFADSTGVTVEGTGGSNSPYDLAQRVSEQTGIPADFVWAQWYHESGNFSSDLAVNSNNWGGLKGEDGDYLSFNSPEEFADYFAKYIVKYAGITDASTIEEYARILKDQHYYEASLGNYTKGMYNALSTGENVSSGSQSFEISGLSDVATPDKWKSLTTEEKAQFVQEHKDQIQNADLLLSYLKEELKREQEYAKMSSDVSKERLAIVKAQMENSDKLIQAATEEANRFKTVQLYIHGLGITAAQKAEIDLQALNTEIEAVQTELKQYSPGDKKYGEIRDKLYNLQMQRDTLQNQTVPDAKYNDTLADLEHRQKMSELALPTNMSISQAQDKSAMEIQYAEEKVKALEDKLKKLREGSPGVETDEIKRTEEAYAQAVKNLVDLREAYVKQVKEAEYDILDDVLLKGERVRDVWKKLWSGMAEDALKALMGIQSGSHGILSTLIGVGKPSVNSGSSGSLPYSIPYSSGSYYTQPKYNLGDYTYAGAKIAKTLPQSQPKSDFGLVNAASALLPTAAQQTDNSKYKFNTDYSSLSFTNRAADEAARTGSLLSTGADKKQPQITLPKQAGTDWSTLFSTALSLGKGLKLFAEGGVTDGPSIAGEDGKEVVIPIEKNTQHSQRLLSYAAGKVGTNVVPSLRNPEKAQQTAQQVTSERRDYTRALEEQNSLTRVNNQILTYIANNSKGGNTVAQPVVLPTQPSDDDLYKQIMKMQAHGYSFSGN
jgi:phage tail tape measure protein, TP901 family, core region